MKLQQIVALLGFGALLGLLGNMNPEQSYASFLMFAGMIVLVVGILMAVSHKGEA